MDAIHMQISVYLKVWEECDMQPNPLKHLVNSSRKGGSDSGTYPVILSFDAALSTESSTLAIVIKDGWHHFIKAIVNFNQETDVCLAEATACLEAITEATSTG
ncbi:hypothetical protein Ancab_011758 [Ancistrocladus abbreviatus]